MRTGKKRNIRKDWKNRFTIYDLLFTIYYLFGYFLILKFAMRTEKNRNIREN